MTDPNTEHTPDNEHAPEDQAPGPGPDPAAEPGASTLNRGWVAKIAIIAIGAYLLAGWFYYDATIAFPARGERSALWFELDYLRAADEAGTLGSAGIEDPVGALADAPGVEELARLSESRRSFESAKRSWLESLRVIDALDSERTTIPRDGVSSARERLGDLETQLASRNQPKPLDAKDIPVQWLMFYVCVAVGVLVTIHIVRISRQVYRWDPEGSRLSLPGGAVLTPDDIDEFDKRKWDKFLIFLKVAQSHDKLGGQELKIDLLRHTNVESWVLAMERAKAGDEVGAAPAADNGAGEAEQA